jgi:hypothetical protein
MSATGGVLNFSARSTAKNFCAGATAVITVSARYG